jgi:hypothetical protein
MIVLVSPDGRRKRLRWTDQHPLSSFGLGVVLRAKSSVPMDGATFASMARDGWRIECDTDLERRRVAGALAWSALGLDAKALTVRNHPQHSATARTTGPCRKE